VEIQVGVQVQLAVVSYIHHMEEVAQQTLQWWEQIQPFSYHSFMEKGRRTPRSIYLFVKIFGQLNKSQMRTQK
jgi:hypothetical protein